MVIINKEKEVCNGIWKKEQGQERSMLDSVISNSKLLLTVKEMIIDENKQYGVFRLEKKYKNILRPQHKSTKVKPHYSKRETKEEQNSYQMWIQKI